MQWRYEQVSQQLTSQPLAAIYLVSGDEPLLVQIACDHIRHAAKKQGFSEREVFHAETGFNWQTLLTRSNNYGLFAEKQILELHLVQGFSEAATEMLKTYANNPPTDKLLLIITGKLDRRQQQTTWFKQLDAVGVFIPIWSMEPAQLARWITERLAIGGLKVEKEAIQCLMSATEGNLLATAQEIEKLRLYFGTDTNQVITRDNLMEAFSDNARFDPFKLTNAALQGEAKHCLRILNRLKEEGVEPLLILWALSRECRQLATLAFQLEQGKNLRTLFQTYHIWEKRQGLFQQALRRHSLTHWYRLLRFAARTDRTIKGVETNAIWPALHRLCLAIAGIKIV
jgi:DNA polymerase III subunit delta